VTPKATRIVVKIDGKKVGEIAASKGGGYHYRPNGGKVFGETFATILEVQQSVEGEDA
jgi:hypothetical protein